MAGIHFPFLCLHTREKVGTLIFTFWGEGEGRGARAGTGEGDGWAARRDALGAMPGLSPVQVPGGSSPHGCHGYEAGGWECWGPQGEWGLPKRGGVQVRARGFPCRASFGSSELLGL